MDVRTFGEIGSNLYAIESGTIHRIKISPNNYGKAVYLKLNDGNIILYSHLNKFNEEIESLIKKLHNEYQSSFFDHFLNSEQKIIINKGDIIGYTGDTGSLTGPHLHFEIRNENDEPLNPLEFYKLPDSTSPIVNSIIFIPLNENAWIDGIQDYKNIEFEKINTNKYVIQDTISVIGEFGIAVETFDKIDNLSFKYGVYKIEVLLNNILIYKVEFDNYNFSEDYLIYTVIDYDLLQNGQISHRLFKQNNSDLSFIKSINNGRIIVDNKMHNLVINISDINNNITQIQGVLTGDLINSTNIIAEKKENKIQLTIDENNKNKVFLNVTSKYNDIENTKAKIKQISNNKFEITKYDNNLDIIEFYTKNNNGIKSRNSFLSTYKVDPYKINGEIIIKHIDSGIIIEFHEEEHTGENPNLEIISSDNTTHNYSLYRKEKNVLSSQIININDIKRISIIYNTQPEIVYSKDVFTALPSKNKNNINFNGYNLNLSSDSFYNNTLIICSEEKEYKLNKKFTEISKPIKIEPSNIPFKKEIKIEYNIPNCDNCALYKYSYEDEKWNYLNTNNNLEVLNTKITSGGTFCILSETEQPIIKNLKPRFNTRYKQKDFKKITFNIDDRLSGINPYSIDIKLDGKKIFYDYIKYRNLVSADLEILLSKGNHTIEITVNDKANNTINLQGDFIIIE